LFLLARQCRPLPHRLVHGIGRVGFVDRLDHQNETALLQKQTSQASMDSATLVVLGAVPLPYTGFSWRFGLTPIPREFLVVLAGFFFFTS